MIWEILGIEETKDKKAITRAFRERLSAVNPEEKPEEFKELRAAYEQALALADSKEVPKEEKTEQALWTEELEALYFDLQKRLDTKAWEELFECDFCQALDTRPVAEDALLAFLQNHFHISHEVMVYLDRKFGFTEHMNELRERYPADFLKYVIEQGVRLEDSFPFALFTPGVDGQKADYYCTLYRKALRTPPAEAADLYEQMRTCSEQHPYGEALLLRIRQDEGDGSAPEKLKELCDRYPQDEHLAIDLMYAFWQAGRPDAVEAIADACLERASTTYQVRLFKAKALAERNCHQEAIEIVDDLLREQVGEYGTSAELDNLRRAWNEVWMEELRETLAKEPDNAKVRYDLMWCLIENEREEEAMPLAEALPFEQPHAFGYYNVKAVLANKENRQEDTLMYLQKLLETVEQMQPDGTEETLSRIGRRSEIRGRIASVLYGMGRKDEAISKAEQSVAEGCDDIGAIFSLISMHLETWNAGRAAELAKLALEMSPGNSIGYYFTALTAFRLGQQQQAFEAINNALEKDPTTLSFYLLKLRILVHNNALEEAQQLIDFLQDNGITKNMTLDFCRMQMFARKESEKKRRKTGEPVQEEYDEILELADEIDAQLSVPDSPWVDWVAHFYYLYASLLADWQNFTKMYPTEPIIKVLDKGIEKDPHDYYCLSYKAWLLKKSKKSEEALALYQKLEQMPGHEWEVEEALAELYYGKQGGHKKEALHYYQMMLEQNPEDVMTLFYTGMCLFQLERPEEAETCFRKLQEISPDDIDGPYRLAYVLLKQNRLEEAVLQGVRTVELAKKRKENTVRFWTPLICAYRRMNRTEEAIAAVMDCQAQNPEWKSFETIVDIYLQAGMKEEARKVVKNQGRGKLTKESRDAKIKLLLADNDMKKLHRIVSDMEGTIVGKQGYRILKAYEASRGKNLKAYLKSVEKPFQRALATGNLSYRERHDYALALFLCGEVEKARGEAVIALKTAETNLQSQDSFALVYQCRRIGLLAILGREEEARAAYEEAGTIPPCESCECGACKDREIFLCELELVFGNYEKAMELARKGRKTWPDDPDFLELMYLILAKGKR